MAKKNALGRGLGALIDVPEDQQDRQLIGNAVLRNGELVVDGVRLVAEDSQHVVFDFAGAGWAIAAGYFGPDPDIVGLGEAPSRGLRKGVVVNVDATVQAVKAANQQ